MSKRTIEKIVTGRHQTDGAGVHLVRVLSRSNVRDFDPFLMLDAFDSVNPEDYVLGFPWHPHRGIETVTYLIHGDIEHGDSLGNKGSIRDGCCQWMTAGSGIIHQEMPKACPKMLGVQLWLNLPAKDKMTAPQYRDIQAHLIPRIEEEGCTTGIISGHYKGTEGPTKGDYVPMTFLDVQMAPGASWSMETEEGHTLFTYIVEGSGSFDDAAQEQQAKRALLFGDGAELAVQAGQQGMRFLLCCAKPLGEPVAWGGPIVMNTQEELELAFAEIDRGTFLK